jgi:predicted nucleic acid-binding protein
VGVGDAGLILDTNALSAAAEEDAAVLGILADARELALPVVVIGEYRYGIARSRRASIYRQWLDKLIEDCRVLDVSNQTTHHYATIAVELRQAGRPIPTNDIWIAALCRQHSLPVLSRDLHFDTIAGVKRLSW